MNELFKFLSSLSQKQLNYILILFIAILIFTFIIGKLFGKLESKVKLQKTIKLEREDAIKRSRSVLNGQINEQLSPLLPDFPAAYDEVKFLGKPVDFIAFKGLDSSLGENEKTYIDKIVFIEIKTGSSKLSEREKAIKNAVDEGRVSYEIWHRP